MTAPRIEILSFALELRRFALGGAPPELTEERAAALVAALDGLVVEHATLAALVREVSDDEVFAAARRLDVPRHLPALAAWRDRVLAHPARAEPLAVAAAFEVTALQRACSGDSEGAQDAKARAERARRESRSRGMPVRVPTRAVAAEVRDAG